MYPNLMERPEGWKPSFGQARAALSHLEKYGVGEGDIFLYFGWFREAEISKGRWRFVQGSPDLHLIYAYLEVGNIWKRMDGDPPAFLAKHPHIFCEDSFPPSQNAIFIGADICSLDSNMKGCDSLSFDHKRVLTGIEGKRSRWILPSCLFKRNGICKLSYHDRQKGEKLLGRDEYLITAVPRGQEFVVELDDHTKKWIWDLLK